MKQITNCRFKLHSGVLLIDSNGVLPEATSANLTDEIAIAYLRDNIKRKSMFETLPDDLEELLAEKHEDPTNTKDPDPTPEPAADPTPDPSADTENDTTADPTPDPANAESADPAPDNKEPAEVKKTSRTGRKTTSNK